MKLIKKNRKNKGFTLIELMVVVSIILIFSAFLVPKVLGYQDKAKKAKIVNTATQIFEASMESYNEEDGVLDGANLFSSISAVTDVVSDSKQVVIANDNSTVTVTFADTDKKTYNVAITASNGGFTVYTGASTSPAIYDNKKQ